MPQFIYYVSGQAFVEAKDREEANRIVKENERYGVSGWDTHHKIFVLVVPTDFSHEIPDGK